jgi:glycosyltransferase involved in cell wall biosynthesis
MRKAITALRPALIYANTAAVRRGLDFLQFLDVPVLTHVHELEQFLERIGANNVTSIFRRTDRFIAVSEAVRSNLVEVRGVPTERVDLIHEFIATEPRLDGQRDERLRRLSREAGVDLGPQTILIGAVGTTDWRKGAHLFVPLARALLRRCGEREIHLLWIGGFEGESLVQRRYEAAQAGLHDRVHFLGQRPDPLNYVDLCDIFVLLSTEDPYPLVVLEAAALGKPIVCFAGSGGAPEFVENDCGFVVPYLDLEAVAERIAELIEAPELRKRMGTAARMKVQSRHDVNIAAPQILNFIERVARRQGDDGLAPRPEPSPKLEPNGPSPPMHDSRLDESPLGDGIERLCDSNPTSPSVPRLR